MFWDGIKMFNGINMYIVILVHVNCTHVINGIYMGITKFLEIKNKILKRSFSIETWCFNVSIYVFLEIKKKKYS